MTECGKSPVGASWPVCSLLPDHGDVHESADFWWYDDDTAPNLKCQTCGMNPARCPGLENCAIALGAELEEL